MRSKRINLRFSVLPFAICNIAEQRSIGLDKAGNNEYQPTEDFLIFSKRCKNYTLIVVEAGPRRF